MVKRNGGAPGIDGETFQRIESKGLGEFLRQINIELKEKTYKPGKNRRVEIPKEKGEERTYDPQHKRSSSPKSNPADTGAHI